jgi:MinD-like ATPase involved in chromosome partitioning or flagellar assembly
VTQQTIPRWPVITATVQHDGSGEIHFTDHTEPVEADDLPTARDKVRAQVAEYAREHLGRPVRLEVSDPDGRWLLGVDPDGGVQALEHATEPDTDPAQPPAPPAGENDDVDVTTGRQPMRVVNGARTNGSNGSNGHGPELEVREHGLAPRTVNRRELNARPQSPFRRLAKALDERLKDPEQREEEALDERFSRRYLVTDTNLVAVVSPKGGPGKTTVAVVIGDALSSRLPNQRIGAIDFNPGGGALDAVASEERSARYTLLQLYHDRESVRSHAQLQPYVASLQSGLDLLAVPPDPGLALTIRPEHYQHLFDQVLVPNYNVLLLDTSPDITSPVTQLALQRATQMVIVLEQGYVSSGVVLRNLRYLLSQAAAGPGGSRATVVINRVLTDPRAGRLEQLREEIAHTHSGPVIEIPWDLDLRAEIDAGTYALNRVHRRSTRLPLKKLAIHVAENFI